LREKGWCIGKFATGIKTFLWFGLKIEDGLFHKK